MVNSALNSVASDDRNGTFFQPIKKQQALQRPVMHILTLKNCFLDLKFMTSYEDKSQICLNLKGPVWITDSTLKLKLCQIEGLELLLRQKAFFDYEAVCDCGKRKFYFLSFRLCGREFSAREGMVNIRKQKKKVIGKQFL